MAQLIIPLAPKISACNGEEGDIILLLVVSFWMLGIGKKVGGREWMFRAMGILEE